MLPWLLDGLSDRWWGLTPRRRATAAIVAVVAATAGVGAASADTPLGPPTTVLVATTDLPTGTVLGPDDVRPERWPERIVPDAVVTDPAGTLRTALPAGAVLTAGHVTDDGLGAVVGAGRAAVPVPAELLPDLSVGDRLRVIGPAMDGSPEVLADVAVVVALDGVSVWLDVADSDAPAVTAGGLRGTVGIAVLPPADAPPASP